jgi:SAM-dependent methyltransferase
MGDSIMRRLLSRFRRPSKAEAEMQYWLQRAADGPLTGLHYERAFTSHFALAPEFFEGKRVLDIGCGPRGSLEWASMAAERIGVDPLAARYRELGTDRHAMRYVDAPAEDMPFPDGSFDVICTLNSLDHVEDIPRTIREITRVASPGATLLLMVEVGHKPTVAEPHSLTWEVIDEFSEWQLRWSARNGVRPDHDLYASIDQNLAYHGGAGLLRARLTKLD